MTDLQDFGRSTGDRIQYLMRELSEQEKKKYFRLGSFVKIWSASTGGSFDINEHTDFFHRTNMYALRQIDAVFYEKFGKHIEEHPHQLDMDDEEWKVGIQPCKRST